jgi:citronellol/citronellal dehydrogenase
MSYASVFAPNLFAGRVVIGTGGGSGIGRCTAHELAALGARVVLVGRKLDKLQAVVSEITQDGGQASLQVCDIRQEERVKDTVAAVLADIWGSMPGMDHSGAVRAGMVSFTETAAVEWAGQGVRLNAVSPGYIASSGTDNYPPDAAPMLRAMAGTVPLGRFGTESETAAGQRDAVKPFNGFHRAQTPKVFA